ncbi:MAG: MBL fold metallo-hydrolase [Candidatus Hadarchaeales archaeon]
MEKATGETTATVTVYDGENSIGGNKIHIESNGKGVLLDFGLNFKQMEKFYEEYLKPRSGRGLHDYLAMGLVPPIDVFQPEIFPTDIQGIGLHSVKVDALLLSHAHMDHAGCIGLLRRDIPIYCTPMSAAILKAHRDAGRSELHSEVVYSTPREQLPDESRILRAADYRKANFVGRNFFLFGKPSKELQEFWKSCPAGRPLDPGIIEEAKEPPLPMIGFEVDHSIYGAAAFAIETDAGWIVYTGDLRLHGRMGEKTRKFVEEAAKLDPRLLIIEGTRMGEGRERQESEENVREKCLSAVSEEKGLVIADFSPRNFERLETFLTIAKETGRHLVVLAKDAYMLDAVRTVDGTDRMKEMMVYKELKEDRFRWEGVVKEKFGEKFVDPREIARDPGRYILCFSFWDIKNLLDIRPSGGTYIYSSSEAHNEEDVFDFKRLWKWLEEFNLRTRGFQMRRGRPVFEPGFHASGHASADELLEIVEAISPGIVIPVHTEHPSLFKRILGARVKIPKKGKPIHL